MKKNPIGLQPRFIHVELRLRDIVQACERYQREGKEIPKEWKLEHKQLSKWLEEFTRKNTRKI